ncbi:DUF4437 domain-containing protein [Okeania hirsuta]|uniref:DUF4437 domain-containing protein n=2 Tax=Microcoleaceae TaxID=1892252 RepID=A0A3N6PEZ7_9CYAN|nr:DUF4437 domain-containing protein [Okeania sp. SIO1F9]RQH11932.1 DUF4437 domain-containing protein [Okeania hirsuta]RQH47520.1 DUF4437 domain-containing protein [Okeania hirsuta]
MGENQENSNSEFEVPSIKEDWGGDGRGRMNLSGRSTAISPQFIPRQYQIFDSNTVPEILDWRIQGMPETVPFATRRLLSWHNCGASTSRVSLPPQFTAPAGIFTADLEIFFVLSGVIQIGEWQLDKHSYSFIPAGVRVDNWKVLGDEPLEILWMENGVVPFKYEASEIDHPDARMSEFIPALDSKFLPWGKTETSQFEVAKKKYLRKDNNGGGVWLIAILPHYYGHYPAIQSYNEEGYTLVGYMNLGNYQLIKNWFHYCPSFSTVPRNITDDGFLAFVRVYRDISKPGRVLSYIDRL